MAINQPKHGAYNIISTVERVICNKHIDWFPINKKFKFFYFVLHINYSSGFGGLEVACWPLVPDFAGSNPAETVGFLGRKNSQHAFLRRGSKPVGPMS